MGRASPLLAVHPWCATRQWPVAAGLVGAASASPFSVSHPAPLFLLLPPSAASTSCPLSGWWSRHGAARCALQTPHGQRPPGEGPSNEGQLGERQRPPPLNRCCVTTGSSVSSDTSAGATTSMSVWPNGGGLVHPQAALHPSVVVEAGAVVWDEASVGEDAVIGSGSIVGPRVRVGARTVLSCNVSLSNCRVGESCLFHHGVSIGAEGFGFYVDGNGNMVKKPQTLGVVIGDKVEIGANSCVDRGSWRDTTIGDETKIDNLVQVGHNVVIGRCCIICGQTGLGGSSSVGDYVVLAGQVGVADHVSIASQVRVGAKSGVTADITKPGDYAGYPAVPASEWRRQMVLQRKAGRGVSKEEGDEHHA